MENMTLRPKIICHMVNSIDGRILLQRWTPHADPHAKSVSVIYEEIASTFSADGWIVGRRTMAEMVEGSARAVAASEPLPRTTHVASRHRKGLAIAVDPHGKLHYGSERMGEDHLVAILGEQVSDAYLHELREDGVSYVFAGERGDDLLAALSALHTAFGVETLLLEGGGTINGAFLKAGLIDEISLLVYPGIDGLASNPSTFEYQGAESERPAAGLSLRHLSTQTLAGGAVWLRYGVIGTPSVDEE